MPCVRSRAAHPRQLPASKACRAPTQYVPNATQYAHVRRRVRRRVPHLPRIAPPNASPGQAFTRHSPHRAHRSPHLSSPPAPISPAANPPPIAISLTPSPRTVRTGAPGLPSWKTQPETRYAFTPFCEIGEICGPPPPFGTHSQLSVTFCRVLSSFVVICRLLSRFVTFCAYFPLRITPLKRANPQ
jgi:hypothetical protein